MTVPEDWQGEETNTHKATDNPLTYPLAPFSNDSPHYKKKKKKALSTFVTVNEFML